MHASPYSDRKQSAKGHDEGTTSCQRGSAKLSLSHEDGGWAAERGQEGNLAPGPQGVRGLILKDFLSFWFQEVLRNAF